MPNYHETFSVDDLLEIAGLYADGTREHSATPPTQYQDKPKQKWRVAEVTDDSVRLRPVLEDGRTIDAFRDMGEYWIRPSGFEQRDA